MRERKVTHRKTIGRLAIRTTDQSAHLVEAESDVAATTNEAQAMNIWPAIDPPTVRAAIDATQKPDLLVVSNGSDRAARSLGGSANTHA